MVKPTVKALHATVGSAGRATCGTGRPVDIQSPAAVPRRLLAVASRLFAEKGFDSTSIQEIVEMAGVTKGAMYHYFRSKEDLLYGICFRVLHHPPEQLEKSTVCSDTVEQRLHKAATDLVTTTIANLDDMVTFSRSVHLLPSKKQTELRVERGRYHDRFRRMIKEGQRSGVFRNDKPADLIVYFYFGAVNYLWLCWGSNGSSSEENIGEQFADMLLDLLRG